MVRAPPHAPPVFVLTARHLLARRTHVVAMLASVSLDDDVTMVLCADATEVRCLSAARLSCLHPTALRHNWHNASVAQGMLAPGTLSLALKHKLAVAEMLRRGLSAALVLEDDVVFRTDLWDVLHTPLPADAEIAWLGSYRRYTARSLWNHPWANGTRGEWRERRRWRWPSTEGGGVSTGTETLTTSERQLREGAVGRGRTGRQGKSRGQMHQGDRMHERAPAPPEPNEPEYARGVPIVGSVAYIMLATAAQRALTPVNAPSDVALSWFGSAEPAATQYGPPVWLAWQTISLAGNTHSPNEAPATGARPGGEGCGGGNEAAPV